MEVAVLTWCHPDLCLKSGTEVCVAEVDKFCGLENKACLSTGGLEFPFFCGLQQVSRPKQLREQVAW